ncbi:MAG TPA: tail fiber protein [Leptospiraceae bacterium]|nr:tail fiber protein [Leptospiraceae bacterium]HNF23923.1 tail fiber protein [Leptospiraceae bacterium]HNI25223.1 tail fiber protein [Leptospiraceae bacterium]HNI95525.1 tail fiber protein [Leptospiraceae bacterium]
MKRYIYKLKKGIFTGLGIALGIILGIGSAALFSVSVDTIFSFSSGTPLSSAQVNQNFANLKKAVEGISPVEPGTILSFGGETPPDGYLLCKGQAVSRTTYASLYAVIRDSFGNGDGSTTFNVPDFRGRFLRGWDDGAGRDPDIGSRLVMNPGGNAAGGLGSIQDDELRSHTHTYQQDTWSCNYAVGGGCAYVAQTGSVSGAFGGNETRPKNAYVNFIIKY